MANELPEFSVEAVSRSVRRFRRSSDADSLSDAPAPAHDNEEIIGLLTALEGAGFIAPFDWNEWASQLGPNWKDDPDLIESADLDTLRRLLIAHQRVDRVHRNHLDTIFRSGYMTAFFERLERILGT